ncbi:AfsR/SARP family transcriptional regulator [Streptomyces sp. NPDC086023]|uniref:AfsR/SARP family transcriptional regulator n=1 Tax=Streptomyces sp. NPDC086023 TaxID=3365746 RepID=UPI0037CE313D
MEFRLLGAVEVIDGDTGEKLAVPRKRERLLLAVLLLETDRAVTDDRLTDLLWHGHPPTGAPGALRSHVSRLRALLPPDVATLDRQGEGYRLRTDPERVDAHRFRTLVRAAGTEQEPAGRSALLTSALRLWRGPALADAAPEAVRSRLCAGLDELRLQALDQRITADFALGRHRDLVAELTGLLADHPAHEVFAAHLMLALYRCGRQAEALRVHAATRRAVAEELGLDPGPRLRSLHERILRADPGLDADADRMPSGADANRTPSGADAAAPATALTAPRATAEIPPQGAAPVPPRGAAPAAATAPTATPPTRAPAQAPVAVLPAAPAPAAPAPCTLPYDAPDFSGREAELARLLSLAARPSAGAPSLITLDGMAGVGKTTLAVHAAHRLAEGFPDGRLFVDLHAHAPNRPPLDPGTALAGLLRTIGVPPERIPPSADERAAAWRNELQGRRILLVLDNAGADQVRPLLPGSAGSLVLVTGRQRIAGLPGAAEVCLDVLPAEEAHALFVRLAGPERTEPQPAEVGEAVELCGRLPLAIRLAAARLRHRPLWTVADLVARLRRGARLDELAVGDERVAAAFALSYEQLDPAQQRMFRLLGGCPGHDVDAYAAAALGGLTLPAAERLLEDLLDVHLLTQRLPGRYVFHDLVREYAGRLAGSDRDAVREAAHRLLDQQLHLTGVVREAYGPGRLAEPQPLTHPPREVPELTGHRQIADWCENERANLLASITAAADVGLPAHAWQLTFNLADFFRTGGHHDDSVTAHTAAVDAARAAGDRAAEALSLLNLGVAHWGAQSFRAAVDCGERALRLVRALGDTRREAVALTRTAMFRLHLGEYERARDDLRRALAVVRETGPRREEGVALWLLGDVLFHLGDHEGAIAAATAAMGIDHEIGDDFGVVLSLIRIGAAEGRLGRHTAGREHLRAALDGSRALHDAAHEVTALVELADLERSAGRTGDAGPLLDRAFALLRDLHRPESAARAHLVAGEVHLDEAEPARALADFESALHLATGLGHTHLETLARNAVTRARCVVPGRR